MDLLTKISNSIYISPIPSPIGTSNLKNNPHSETSFPIIAIAIIGILATIFLLVTYYLFVIKCCLNWHRIDILRRLSPSSRHRQTLPMPISPPTVTHGLDESVIRSIPLLHYKKTTPKTKSSSDCAVCLSEFEENEILRRIPICNHLFHIDCIDIWLQNNANCPLCRTNISSSNLITANSHQIFPSSSSFQDPNPNNDENFVVIELGGIRNDPFDHIPTGELTVGKLGKRRKLQKVTSLGDEWIDMSEKDEQFCIQPIRRSVSMDSSTDRQLYLAVAAAAEVRRSSPVDGGNSGRGRRSFFSFGHSWISRNSVLPLDLEES